jgi:alpha-1,6-mannosyltransferase
MAEHVQALWRGNYRAMGDAARKHVEQRFSWNKTFAQLVNEVYPAAMMRAIERRSAVYRWAEHRLPELVRSAV